MAVPRGWCLHGYRCGAEKKGTGGRWRQEGDDERGWEREEGTYVPTYRRGWCIAYYLCVVFVAALRAFFCSHRLLFISTNVQLYWSAIYHPHPAPPTPPMDFFPLFENVSGLCRGDGSLLRLARRDGTTADATLCCAGMSRNFILPSWMPRLNLPPGSLFLHAATVLHGENLAILIFLWYPALSCLWERIPNTLCCAARFEPCGHGSAAALVYGYFELDDITTHTHTRTILGILVDTRSVEREGLYFISAKI